MKHDAIDPEMTAKVCEIVLRERELALSDREWKFRLRGYGYAIREGENGPVITSLLKGGDICALPDARAVAA